MPQEDTLRFVAYVCNSASIQVIADSLPADFHKPEERSVQGYFMAGKRYATFLLWLVVGSTLFSLAIGRLTVQTSKLTSSHLYLCSIFKSFAMHTRSRFVEKSPTTSSTTSIKLIGP